MILIPTYKQASSKNTDTEEWLNDFSKPPKWFSLVSIEPPQYHPVLRTFVNAEK